MIFLQPLSLPCFRCSALSRTESRLDQCIVFLFQSHSSELKTRKVTQVRFGRGGGRTELLEAPSRPIYEFAWMFVCVCLREGGRESGVAYRGEFNKFIMCVSNNLIIPQEVSSACLEISRPLPQWESSAPCFYKSFVTLPLPSYIKLQVLHNVSVLTCPR